MLHVDPQYIGGPVPRPLGLTGLATGLLGGISGVGSLGGLPLHGFLGASIIGGACMFAIIGVRIGRSATAKVEGRGC
jgi:hypothetical protein